VFVATPYTIDAILGGISNAMSLELMIKAIEKSLNSQI